MGKNAFSGCGSVSSRDIQIYLKIVEQKCLLVKIALQGFTAKFLKLSLQIGNNVG